MESSAGLAPGQCIRAPEFHSGEIWQGLPFCSFQKPQSAVLIPGTVSTAHPSDGHWRAAVAFKAVASGRVLLPAPAARHPADGVLLELLWVAFAQSGTGHDAVSQELARELCAHG
jgi:hypothetical protein